MTTRWGLLATGRIAHTLARAIEASTTAELVAVGSRTVKNAEKFAEAWPVQRIHGSYEALLEDADVDAVYVSTPHPMHAEWTVKALEAGKDVLCEKPMGLNHPDVMAMVHAARTNERVLLEAFMYRFHPQTRKLVELVRGGAIGDIRHIHATFGFHAPYNPEGRLFKNELGGGGIMDVGCYPMSMARLLAGSEPAEVSAHAVLTETEVDAYASALVRFDNGAAAHIATGVGQQLDNSVAVFGSEGRISVSAPWLGPPSWNLKLATPAETKNISGSAENSYVYEVDEVDRLRREGLRESPQMDWRDSLNNAIALDRWRAAAGVKFIAETPAGLAPPIHGVPIQPREPGMEYASVPGIESRLSRLVMGCDNQQTLTHAALMFDQFFELGGNVFDTAYIYGGGRCETLLGEWLRSRAVRDQVHVIDKGAHTPLNRPEYVRSQLETSLERLQTEYIDVYFLHRDNIDVPVGEWVDALNEIAEEGLVRIFGGSNWQLERITAANEYAATHRKQPMQAISNQFSLARMVEPVWAGCYSASDAAFRAHLQTTQLPLFPWSSQARGFFTPRFESIRSLGESTFDAQSGHQPNDSEMVRCWFADDNFERRDRAVKLARERGVEAIHIALAYVLAQPFPTFPLIGPRFMDETTSSALALSVKLDNNERQWLNLERPQR